MLDFLHYENRRMLAILDDRHLSTEEEQRFQQLKGLFADFDINNEDKREQFFELLPEYRGRLDVGVKEFEAPIDCVQGHRRYDDANPEYLTEDQAQFMRENGYLGPMKLHSLTPSSIASIKKTISCEGAISNFYFQSKQIMDLAVNPEILAKVESIIGDNVVFINDTVLVVNPDGGQLDVNHTDIQGSTSILGGEFYADDPGILNVWISVSGTNPDNAPLQLFPGTHTLGIIPIASHIKCIQESRNGKEYYSKLFALLEPLGKIHVTRSLRMNIETMLRSDLSRYQETKRTELYTDPGDCILFNGHIFHGTTQNSTDAPRMAVALRYRSATHAPIYSGLTIDSVQDLFSSEEIAAMSLTANASKVNIIQVLGNNHHHEYHPINHARLIELLDQHNYQ